MGVSPEKLSTEKAIKDTRDLLQGLAGVSIASCTGTKSGEEEMELECMIKTGPKGKELSPLRIKVKSNGITEMEVSVKGRNILV